MLKVLVADDHPVFRAGVKQIIAETNDISVGCEVSNGWDAVDVARSGRCDVMLLDISMPGKDGLDVLRDVKEEKLGIPVLILSMHPEEQYAIQALKAGAAGYLTKESAADELVTAIRKVASGGKHISGSLAEKLASYVQNAGEESPHRILSSCEYQVMRLIAAGKTPTEIAAELSLSVKTISTYRVRILSKLDMKSNAELVRYAVKNKLVD